MYVNIFVKKNSGEPQNYLVECTSITNAISIIETNYLNPGDILQQASLTNYILDIKSSSANLNFIVQFSNQNSNETYCLFTNSVSDLNDLITSKINLGWTLLSVFDKNLILVPLT